MTEEGRNLSNDTELSQISNIYFPNIVSDLRIPNLINNDTFKLNYPVSIVARKRFDQDPSIINIKKRKFESILNSKKLASLKQKKWLTIWK